MKRLVYLLHIVAKEEYVVCSHSQLLSVPGRHDVRPSCWNSRGADRLSSVDTIKLCSGGTKDDEALSMSAWPHAESFQDDQLGAH